MNLSRNWLAQYVNTGSDVAELCRKLTMAGIEVESVAPTNGGVRILATPPDDATSLFLRVHAK